MDYTQFIKAELLVLAVALYGLGLIIKHTEFIKNNYIPAVVAAVGVLLSCVYIFGTEGISPVSVFTAIVQGIICASLAVFGDQIIKQSKGGS